MVRIILKISVVVCLFVACQATPQDRSYVVSDTPNFTTEETQVESYDLTEIKERSGEQLSEKDASNLEDGDPISISYFLYNPQSGTFIRHGYSLLPNATSESSQSESFTADELGIPMSESQMQPSSENVNVGVVRTEYLGKDNEIIRIWNLVRWKNVVPKGMNS